MIVKPAAFARLIAARDPGLAAVLIAGDDPMRVALRRQEAVAARIGPEGEAEMRLTRLPAAEVRRDPAALADALAARGFFPGPRVVLLEEAGDGLDAVIGAALEGWRPGDAQLIVTAGALTGKSALKARFEAGRGLAALVLYDDPPTRDEIRADLARAGLTSLAQGAEDDLVALALVLEPGDFRQTLEKIALFKWDDPAPLTPAEIAALAPQTVEADADAAALAVADRQAAALARLMRRIEAQGMAPVTLVLAVERHFRTLLSLAAGSPGAAMRLPSRRREAAERQARAWGPARLERALQALMETDLALRSSPRAPGFALLERSLMRLALADG